MGDETKINLMSVDVVAEKIAELRRVFPEAFTEDKIDWEKLREKTRNKLSNGCFCVCFVVREKILNRFL